MPARLHSGDSVLMSNLYKVGFLVFLNHDIESKLLVSFYALSQWPTEAMVSLNMYINGDNMHILICVITNIYFTVIVLGTYTSVCAFNIQSWNNERENLEPYVG